MARGRGPRKALEGEAKDATPGRLQRFRSSCVVLQLLGMLAAIQFDNQLGFATGKAGEGTADRLLAAELKTG
jgi:hypothetical protein